MKSKSRVILAFSMACAMVLTTAMPVAAAKKVGLSSKKLTVKAGASKKLSVKNTKKKVKWSIKSGKKYVSLKKKKKTSVTVQGKKKGKAVILAKVGKKKLTCKVTVKKAEKESETTPANTSTVTPTAPVSTPAVTPTAPVNTPAVTPSAPASTSPAVTVSAPGVVSAAPSSTSPAVTVPARTAEPKEFLYEGLDWDWINANIDPAKPVVAMSFDDGPGGYSSYVEYGTQIQQALKDAGAHATFFYIGQHILHDDESRAEVQQAVDWGFEIANHSWDSSGLNTQEKEDIQKKIEDTDALLREISGYSNFLFRAPNVAYSDDMYAVIDKPFIDVSCWSNDWQSSVTKERIVENVEQAKDGDIINMHSVHEKTAQAVPEILAYFKQKGIQVVSVSELFAIKGQKLMNGVKYNKCVAQ